METTATALVDAPALERACERGLGSAPPEVSPDLEGARTTIRWLMERVARTRSGWEPFRDRFCARTPLEVIGDATVHFTTPCCDLSSVAAALLARARIPATLVLTGITRPLRPVKFQCGLELDVGGTTWVLGFGVSGTSLYEGRFEPLPGRPWIYRRRPTTLDLETPYLVHFDPGGRDGMANVFAGYDLEADVRSYFRRSGALLFRLAARRARTRLAHPRPTNLVAALPFR